jgi:hypothetical protein
MAYVLPQVKVFQEFRIAPVATAGALNSHISGGHAELFRYNVPEEKQLTYLGGYDYLSDTSFSWPGLSSGSIVDTTFVKLYVDSAKLKYYQNDAGVGGTVTTVASHPNRVKATGIAFASNGTSYPKSAELYDRGARVGDAVYVRGVASGTTYELETRISGFIGDDVAATRAAATAASTNKTTQTLSTSIDDLSTIKNSITVTANASQYDGREDGSIDEYYTVEVIQSSRNGDLTTGKIRVTTSSGLDNVASVTPVAAGGFTAIGTRGLNLEFDINGTASASSAADTTSVSDHDLVVGHKWRIHVIQAFTPAVATSGGTYTGTSDTTYIVEVTKGGAFASSPEISVSTTNGVDFSAAVVVNASATAFNVGNQAITVAFSSTGLCKGDKYYIVVTAVVSGYLRTLVLEDDLPTQIQSVADLDLKLYLVRNALVSINKEESAPNVNYSASATELIVKENATAFDSEWTIDGVKTALPIESGDLYVEYRAWLQRYVGDFGTINDPGDIVSLLGTLHPDNPLCWGVFMALQNCNGQDVRFTAVSNPAVTADWLNVLDVVGDREDLYNIVPLTFTQVVIDAYKAHAEDQSGEEVGRWRAVVIGLDVSRESAIVSSTKSSDGAEVLATISDDPFTSGTQYTRLSIPANNAKFLTNKVRAGDTVRYFYVTDGFGRVGYTSYTVEAVISENTIRLKAGPAAPVAVAQKVEIWRNLNNTEYSDTIGNSAGKYSSTRVIAIANNNVTLGGYTNQPSYFLAAAIAGLRSGVNPHQGLTSVSVSGVDYVGDAINGFNTAQLNSIAGDGGWIIIKAEDGSFINRHAVTTNNTDLNRREEQVRTNVDNMSYAFRNGLVPFIGRSNVTATTLTNISITLKGIGDSFLSDTGTNSIGPQLIAYDVVELRQHAVLKDHVVVVVNLTVPYPLNNIELKLVV